MSSTVELRTKRSCSPTSALPRQKEKKNPLTRQERLEAQRDVPVAVRVVALEHVRHALELDAALHEQVEAHAVLFASAGATTRAAAGATGSYRVVGAGHAPRVEAIHHAHELGRERVAKGLQRGAVLVERDGAAAVRVEAVEEGAPGAQEAPEPRESAIHFSLPNCSNAFLFSRL